jgi:hypothetical protein
MGRPERTLSGSRPQGSQCPGAVSVIAKLRTEPGAFLRAAEEVKERGTFTYAADAIPDREAAAYMAESHRTEA